ncbi:putative farnesyltransferase [Triangularia setosa]|uniref:Protein farnesyltransferase/geranylgeranyltransferase type-1 subunit alpha n=1 Tax=Triangularia setosa TaxID=2587417 RepID=A0AAN7A7P4_9PEZI|nr:putative farnesyltransferase [Podospora setosa]
MPPKGKAAQKPKAGSSAATKSQAVAPAAPSTNSTTAKVTLDHQLQSSTVAEQSRNNFTLCHPFEDLTGKKSLSALPTQADQLVWLASRLVTRPLVRFLGAKGQKELWKKVNDNSLPPRGFNLRKYKKRQQHKTTDSRGRDIGEYSTEEWEVRQEKRVTLSCLQLQSQRFRELRDRQKRGFIDSQTGDQVLVTDSEYLEEKQRRREMERLNRELYGTQGMARQGKLALDPEWDDVVPIVMEDPENALAAIAYSPDYAEAMSYLRAVMHSKEYSPRCLKLTEYIIHLNPAHYTVWLFRAANIFALKLPILDEITWLNQIALENLKNYQIWHHRHLLVENYYPSISSDEAALSAFANSERDFLTQILAEDTKNYHVWSYRSWLVGKLGTWSNPEELKSTEDLIDQDVRNNSAWSHRFYLVFSDPENCTPGNRYAATEADPKVPGWIVDREVKYAEEKIRLAPQNQSGWNYLRGVLVKGGRELNSVRGFAEEFVKGLGGGEEGEEVRSSHALDLLAEIYKETGEREKADLCLRRLMEKWDRIRGGYWQWRREGLGLGEVAA